MATQKVQYSFGSLPVSDAKAEDIRKAAEAVNTPKWRVAINYEEHGGDGFVNTFTGTPEEAQDFYAGYIGAEYVSTEYCSSDTIVLNFSKPWADDRESEQAIVVTMTPADDDGNDIFEDPEAAWMDDAMTQMLDEATNTAFQSAVKWLLTEHELATDENDIDYHTRLAVLAGIRIGKGELPPVLPEA